MKKFVADLSQELENLIDPLDHKQLLALTIDQIKEHRRRLRCAEHAHRSWIQGKSGTGIEQGQSGELERIYLEALKQHQIQTGLVASLIDHLGYVPAVDLETPSRAE